MTIIFSFLSGCVFGYLLRLLIERMVKNTPMNEDSFRLILSFVLLSVFAIAFFVSVVDRTYEIPIAFYPLVGAVVGYYFGTKYLSSKFSHHEPPPRDSNQRREEDYQRTKERFNEDITYKEEGADRTVTRLEEDISIKKQRDQEDKDGNTEKKKN